MAESDIMQVQVDVWSDYVCPFCYLEQPVLDRIAQEYLERVRIRWRAFELRPDPVPTLKPDGTYLRDIWARAVYPMAKERGMSLRLPPVQPRSRLAHEAAHFAATQGLFDAMNTALFRAFFEDGRDIGDLAVLVEVGESIGLDAGQLRQALDDGRHRKRVIADEDLAMKLAISGVPALLIHHKNEPLEQATEVSGAQPFEYVRAVLEDSLAASLPNCGFHPRAINCSRHR
jgi:predicted DsbA family dithiol-disulfide isomerase